MKSIYRLLIPTLANHLASWRVLTLAKRTRTKSTQVGASLQNQNLRTDLQCGGQTDSQVKPEVHAIRKNKTKTKTCTHNDILND